MASIDSRGFVDDGTRSLSIAGSLGVGGGGNFGGLLTSSVGSFGELSTVNNAQVGQNLGAPNTFVLVTQWLTSSIATPGVVPNVSSSLTINSEGWYITMIPMSFSGSAGQYTVSLFQNNVQHPNCQLQTNINTGQPQPNSVTLVDMNHYASGDVLDVRVKCTNAGANFQLSNGNFIVRRMIG